MSQSYKRDSGNRRRLRRDRVKPITAKEVEKWTATDLVHLIYELGLCMNNCFQLRDGSWRVNLRSDDNETYFNFGDGSSVTKALRKAILVALKEKKKWVRVRKRSKVLVD